MENSAIRVLVLLALPPLWLAASYAADTGGATIKKEFSKEELIYRSKGKSIPEGYTIDRSLADYMEMLSAGFDRALDGLGPNDRWLDVGAGQGKAILDYFTSRGDSVQSESGLRPGKQVQAVAISIEDRRTHIWRQTAASLGANQIRYLFNRRLREYSLEELGQFRVITDVIGGFSYTDDLSLYMEKVLGFLGVNGSFYTVLADVRSEDGKNRPYYADSPFSTAIAAADRSEVSVCSWLKSISCVEVTCEPKQGWSPPIEAFRIRKFCNDIKVPTLVLTNYEAATPPGRQYHMLPSQRDSSEANISP